MLLMKIITIVLLISFSLSLSSNNSLSLSSYICNGYELLLNRTTNTKVALLIGISSTEIIPINIIKVSHLATWIDGYSTISTGYININNT